MTEVTHQHETTVPPHHQAGGSQAASAKGPSTTGMVLGICSVVFSVGLGLLLGIAAIIFSAIGLKRQKNGLAITGLVTGIVGVVIGLITGFFIGLAVYLAVQSQANESAIASDARTVILQAEQYKANNNSYPSFEQMQRQLTMLDGKSVVIDRQGSDAAGDVIYIPCYGDGAIVWYWSESAEEYKSEYAGVTNDCEWNE